MAPKRARYVVIAFLIIGVFSLIWLRMYDTQVVAYSKYQQEAESKATKTFALTGMRGSIYDANMIPLAYNKRSYDVQFYRDPSRSSEEDRAAYTQAIIEAIRIIENNGKQVLTEFWLKKGEDGVWHFDTGATTEAARAKRESQWRENFYLTKVEEKDLFDALLKNYLVPSDLSEEDKIKVLSVWQQSRMYNFLSQPVTIAENVGFETVSEIEVRSMDLDGVTITESSTRVYPKGDTAAHIVGYISKISGDTAMESYQEKGYPINATVGQTGIEYSMEDQLSQYIAFRQGKKVVEINNRGKIIRERSYEAPIDGNDVILTIDSRLQAVVQQALEKQINLINKGQQSLMNTTAWRNANREQLLEYERAGREVQLATSGAVVAMNPKSGRILAMASYPTFDLTEFQGGVVSSAYWNELINDERNPMYNRAISARDTPGSCFKMVTALAALMEGKLTLSERISDKGKFTDTNDESNQPTCWIGSYNRSKHANQTIIEGLKNSCNYFFYTIGLRVGITNLVKWGATLGLTSRTGVELPNESTSFVGNQNMLYDPDRPIDNQYTSKPYFAAVMIKKSLREVGVDRGIAYDEDRLSKVAKMILDIAGTDLDNNKDSWPTKIRNILLEEMNIPSTYISNHFLVNTFYSYINDLRWTPSETIMAAIGQSITQITPIAAARYVSAICNGGIVYDAQIIDKIISPTGKIVLDKEPVIVSTIKHADEYLEAINEGMREVTSVENDGTAAQQFSAPDVKELRIAAKTGTAQRTNIDIENNSWLVTYAPYDDPQIVVVVYIQNGYAGARSAPVAIDTIKYYLNSKKKTESVTVPTSNGLGK